VEGPVVKCSEVTAVDVVGMICVDEGMADAVVVGQRVRVFQFLVFQVQAQLTVFCTELKINNCGGRYLLLLVVG
jgi:hypothetical protein